LTVVACFAAIHYAYGMGWIAKPLLHRTSCRDTDNLYAQEMQPPNFLHQ